MKETTQSLEHPVDDSQHPNNAPDSSFTKTAQFSLALHDPSQKLLTLTLKLLQVFLRNNCKFILILSIKKKHKCFQFLLFLYRWKISEDKSHTNLCLKFKIYTKICLKFKMYTQIKYKTNEKK